jgi:hypothetical protein
MNGQIGIEMSIDMLTSEVLRLLRDGFTRQRTSHGVNVKAVSLQEGKLI